MSEWVRDRDPELGVEVEILLLTKTGKRKVTKGTLFSVVGWMAYHEGEVIAWREIVPDGPKYGEVTNERSDANLPPL